MPKTQEELNQLKIEYETINNKLRELTEEELKVVTGGEVLLPTHEPNLTKPAQTQSITMDPLISNINK